MKYTASNKGARTRIARLDIVQRDIMKQASLNPGKVDSETVALARKMS